MSKDYYSILGVSKDASKDEIKKAFHKMAHKYHPDKSGGDEAKFKEVNEAYQTLSNDQKRSSYDQFGSDGPQMGGFGGGAGFDGFDFSNFGGQGGFEFDLGDMFGGMFGGGRARKPRGNDLQTSLILDFKDSIFGIEKEIKVTKPSTCNTCKGDGATPGTKLETCSVCNGNGVVRNVQRTILGSIATNQTCTKCHGTGKIPKDPCKTCHGSGVVKDTRTIKIAVPAGIQNGETLRLSGMGEAVSGGPSGDLYVHISVTPHKTILRKGADLYTNLDIKLTDALLGAQYAVETLDGSMPISIPAGTKIGSTVTIKDKGVPVSKSKRGNFIVNLNIKLPEKLSKESKDLIEELKKQGI
ncbi:molecular chaperone DnaJ [Candidatus Nomurabacteria bacterium]|nr:molecular chaperone DnaJ [Candidatus Nomurabacteria bacterium]